MSHVPQHFLIKDLANIKTNCSDINIKLRHFDEQFKYFNGKIKVINKENIVFRKDTDSRIDKSLSDINNMLVDLISEVHSIKSEVEFLNEKTNEIDNLDKVINSKKIEINKDIKEKCKDVLKFLENLGFGEIYHNKVIELGCKTKEDLKLFKEDELVSYGFMLLHARKVLSSK
tara:strand:- start:123 stop:641 length:519 start_codon:yes stop_codon:yes gene_type:complete